MSNYTHYEKSFLPENYLNDLYNFLPTNDKNNDKLKEMNFTVKIHNINEIKVYCIYKYFVNNDIDILISELKENKINTRCVMSIINNIKNNKESTYSDTKKGVFFVLVSDHQHMPIFIDDSGMKFKLEINEAKMSFITENYI
jgi:hypothetical protein